MSRFIALRPLVPTPFPLVRRGLLAFPLLAVLLGPAVAWGHPLGNFTVNRYSRIELSPEGIRLRYVLDMAEIPTFQALPYLDSNRDGTVDDGERAAYASERVGELGRHLRLSLNGRPWPLRPAAQELDLLPGQGGLQTMRLGVWFEASLGELVQGTAPSSMRLEYRDDNEPERLGWREIVVESLDGITLIGAEIPTQDRSDELRSYPEDRLSRPLDVRHVGFSFTLAAGASDPRRGVLPQERRASALLAGARDRFAELVTADLGTLPAVLGALLTAAALGAMHGLSPGHGKTVVGAYLIGSRGAARHALFLGLSVTATHTAGVLALGLASLWAAQYFLPERLYPWLSVSSGLLVLAIGVALVRRRLRAGGQVAAYAEGYRAHGHGRAWPSHAHPATGKGTDAQAAPDTDPRAATWRSLLALGISGGLVPCPSALVVMLGAIALQQVVLGLALVIAFSVGLAGVLTAIGLLMVYVGRTLGGLPWGVHPRLASRLRGVARAIPLGGAVAVTVVGVALTLEAALQLGLELRLVSAPLW